MTASKLTDLDLPDFGMPKVQPKISSSIYSDRLEHLYERALRKKFNSFIVYGDREHYANITYLTGYDPRFEESLLVLDIDNHETSLLMGHEGLGYFPISPIKDRIKPVLYPSFSLMGQSRRETRPLKQILVDAGIDAGDRVGVAGWKYFTRAEAEYPDYWSEIPSYIVDNLREITGGISNVINANPILMDPTEGLRAINEVDQLAYFEYAACHTSQSLRNVIFTLKPGMTEFQAVQEMKLTGLPLSCHLMLSSGPRAFMGLASPNGRTIKHGDPFTIAFGVVGALNARAGWVVEEASGLKPEVRDYVKKLVSPYFEAVSEWYNHVGLGVTGGSLYKIIHDKIGAPFFGVHLNPGHLIHLEEWLHSPIYMNSELKLRSGMALQVDVIPATGTPYFTTNIEDGIALADSRLRSDFTSKYPDAWERIQMRKDFMMEELNIKMKPEVLPFSNIPGYLPPFLLSPHRAMKLR